MTKRVLIAHHVEPLWESGLQSHGTSFWEIAEDLIQHIEQTPYDQVILTRFESWTISEEEEYRDYQGLANLIDEVYEYGYGWEQDCIEENPGLFKPGGQHSEAVMVPCWLRDLAENGYVIDLCGAFDGQCIDDMETALQHVQAVYNRLDHLII